MIPIPPQVLAAAAKVVLPKLIGAGLSYAQSAKQNKLMKDAEKSAQKAISDAKDFAGALAYEKVQVPLEAYELSQRELTAQQQQGVEALREVGARGILGGVGRVQAAVTSAQQGIQDKMANALFERDKLIAKDEARSFDDLADIAKLEATGAQAAAAQAQAQRGAALTSGTKALTGAITGAFSDEVLNPLYGFLKNKKALKAIEKAGGNMEYNPNDYLLQGNRLMGGVTSQIPGSVSNKNNYGYIDMGEEINITGGNNYGFPG